ncbi:peptidase inhibitor family I36 protein [Streptacidiphilus griseoplanus]|uniref:peptidase inhibitor family I36 protein n=1 Tax=Peterkaempfera griseoplana TaxID=66896 RepID=UPI0006E3B307|nr:peptidase inhibitor family I36 protein [Peterkaempfera griseoplana]
MESKLRAAVAAATLAATLTVAPAAHAAPGSPHDSTDCPAGNYVCLYLQPSYVGLLARVAVGPSNPDVSTAAKSVINATASQCFRVYDQPDYTGQSLTVRPRNGTNMSFPIRSYQWLSC